jgi:hypothetical protein
MTESIKDYGKDEEGGRGKEISNGEYYLTCVFGFFFLSGVLKRRVRLPSQPVHLFLRGRSG